MMTPEWSTACPDWADRLKSGRSIIPPPIFPEEAEAGLAVLRELRIVDAPGSPMIGDACAQWVFDLAASIFGAYDSREGSDTEGRRLITEWFVLVPKKNSKSTVAAAIMLTALIRNWRESAEFTILAPTLEVANNSFAPARDMVRKDEALEDLMQVQTHVKTITSRQNNGTLKVSAADSNTVSGKKSVGTLIEELWLFGKQANAENMLREATGGLASRPEGFVIYITTQSDDPPAGVFLQKLQYARDVRDGVIIDKQFVPIIYEYPDDIIKSRQDRNPTNFGMVNPNINYSVDRDFLEREMRKAEVEGEHSVRGFLAKHLNVEIGLMLRSNRWAGANHWESQALPALSLEELIERCEVIDLGIDGGGLDDLLGFAAVGRCATTRHWFAWTHAWAHPSVLELRKSEAARLHDFKDDGDLTLVEKIGDDVTELVAFAAQVWISGKLDKIGVDPAGLGAILDMLEMEGIPAELVIGIPQGWKMNGAIKTAERKLAGGELWHGGQRLMNWCVGNAKVVAVGNAVTITKQTSGSAKIDPLAALFNAVTLLALNPAATGSSFWDK
ncbi:terminase large subunit [Janthinobacterium sp.]|uniref:terminase large subunit n=1 Tax=Janthinobacterium sp. TaxID=1871054 RepID=UPI002624D3D8|nr:terminase large subunit [Janthinobacterium sp.]